MKGKNLRDLPDLVKFLREDVIKSIRSEITHSVANNIAAELEKTRWLEGKVRIVHESDRLSRVFFEAPGWLLFGSRPHIIRPRRARALRFEIGGEVIFARYVRHPGTKSGLKINELIRRVLPESIKDALERGLLKLGWKL